MNKKVVNVKYKKDKVVITMPFDNYVKICRYLNVFNEAMNDFGETLDFRLSELQAMDYLRWYIINNLGFEKTNKTYYSDYKVPDNEPPVKYKVEGK